MTVGVAHAKPPPAGPSPVCYGGKGTPDLGSPSWSVRLGQACWGSCGRGVDEGRMTSNRNLKRRVRACAAKTGESYAAALRQHRGRPSSPVAAPGPYGAYDAHLITDDRSDDRGAF